MATNDSNQTAPADEMPDKIAKLEAQINDYKMLLADMQNSTRRLKEDSDKQKKYFAEPLASDVLSLLDNLQRTSDTAIAKGESGLLLDGVTATISAAFDMLKRHSVRKIEVVPGSNFDPNSHMAVMQQPTNDFAPGKVVSILQHGFTLHDRVLRPATVIVATEPPAGSNVE